MRADISYCQRCKTFWSGNLAHRVCCTCPDTKRWRGPVTAWTFGWWWQTVNALVACRAPKVAYL